MARASQQNFLSSGSAAGAQISPAQSRYKLGQALAQKGRWEEAIAYYQQALEKDPQRWQVYHLLGDALQASGDLDRAIAAHEKATELAG